MIEKTKYPSSGLFPKTRIELQQEKLRQMHDVASKTFADFEIVPLFRDGDYRGWRCAQRPQLVRLTERPRVGPWWSAEPVWRCYDQYGGVHYNYRPPSPTAPPLQWRTAGSGARSEPPRSSTPPRPAWWGWRDGSGHCLFNLFATPGRLFLTGDVADLIVERAYDMLAWARGAVRDPAYFAEKVVRAIPTREFSPDMVRAWIREERLYRDDGEPNRMSDDLIDSLERAIEWGEHEVHRVLWNADYGDPADPPDFTDFNYNFLWGLEAVKWFLANWVDS